jgi:hypothetical protein
MKKLLLTAAIAVVGAAAAYADIPRPNNSPSSKPKGEMLNMDIKLDHKATEAVLYIPKSQVKALRAQLDQMDDGANTAALTDGDASRRLQTIVSGSLLSLAFVFGGVWFFRSGRAATKTGKGLVVIAVVAGIASAATFVYANAGPPSEARSITGKMFTQAVHIYGFGYGRVRLETTDGDNVRLVVPDPEDKPSE